MRRRTARDRTPRASALASLCALPSRVAVFRARAALVARRHQDHFSRRAPVPSSDLRVLLRLARGHLRVAEIGTGTAWTAIALALAEPRRKVFSCDRIARPERELYLGLVGPDVRRRIRLEEVQGAAAADASGEVDLLFVDSSHKREQTLSEFRAWVEKLAPGAVVIFHDYENPAYPGVTEAIRELGLEGEVCGSFFRWRAPGV